MLYILTSNIAMETTDLDCEISGSDFVFLDFISRYFLMHPKELYEND